MKAIEFSTNIENGAIKVPERYLEKLKNDSFRVIILMKEKAVAKKKRSLKDRFKAIELDTRDFEFNRDKANER